MSVEFAILAARNYITGARDLGQRFVIGLLRGRPFAGYTDKREDLEEIWSVDAGVDYDDLPQILAQGVRELEKHVSVL